MTVVDYADERILKHVQKINTTATNDSVQQSHLLLSSLVLVVQTRC